MKRTKLSSRRGAHRLGNAEAEVMTVDIPGHGISDEAQEKLIEAEARYQAWKQSVIDQYRLAGVAWIQPMDSNYQRTDMVGAKIEEGAGKICLSRSWFKAEDRVQSGGTVVLIRMHRGKRLAMRFELVEPVKNSTTSEWHCRYLDSTILEDY